MRRCVRSATAISQRAALLRGHFLIDSQGSITSELVVIEDELSINHPRALGLGHVTSDRGEPDVPSAERGRDLGRCEVIDIDDRRVRVPPVREQP